MKHHSPSIIIAIFLSSTIILAACQSQTTPPTEDEVMNDFYQAHNRAEDMLMDPLIIHSNIVKSRIIREIKNQDMDKRRYAISFLGNEGIKEALPALQEILNSENEKDYFRADALESIYRIDNSEGIKKATLYSNNNDYLGRIAMGLLDGTHKPSRRSLKQALTGHHE